MNVLMSVLDSLLHASPIAFHAADMLPGVLLAVALFFCLRPIRKRALQGKGLYSSSLREAVLLLFWMFCGGLAVLTLTPRWFSWLVALRYGLPWRPFFRTGTVNLVPLRTFVYDLPYVILGNVVMLLPFGFCTTLLWRRFRWWKALLTGLCVSGLIELWQYFIGRSSDIDDLLLNSFGALCGFWLALVFRRILPKIAAGLQVQPILQGRR